MYRVDGRKRIHTDFFERRGSASGLFLIIAIKDVARLFLFYSPSRMICGIILLKEAFYLGSKKMNPILLKNTSFYGKTSVSLGKFFCVAPIFGNW